MEKVSGAVGFLYQHPLVRYIFVGGSTFVLDISLLICLREYLNVALPVATSLAYWASICYNFILNRHWTFSRREKEGLKRHILAYLTLLAANYLFTLVFVSLVSQALYYGLAKALSVMIQTSWTYVIYKTYIFTLTTPDKDNHSQSIQPEGSR